MFPKCPLGSRNGQLASTKRPHRRDELAARISRSVECDERDGKSAPRKGPVRSRNHPARLAMWQLLVARGQLRVAKPRGGRDRIRPREPRNRVPVARRLRPPSRRVVPLARWLLSAAGRLCRRDEWPIIVGEIGSLREREGSFRGGEPAFAGEEASIRGGREVFDGRRNESKSRMSLETAWPPAGEEHRDPHPGGVGGARSRTASVCNKKEWVQ